MSQEILEIQTLISSDDNSNKCSGYSTLLQFQQHSCLNPSSLQSLAQSSNSIVSSTVSDISHPDEEMWVSNCINILWIFSFSCKISMFLLFIYIFLSVRAAQALKCLGFMIYHPDIVSKLQGTWFLSDLCLVKLWFALILGTLIFYIVLQLMVLIWSWIRCLSLLRPPNWRLIRFFFIDLLGCVIVCCVLTISTFVADCLQFRGLVLICPTVRCFISCHSLPFFVTCDCSCPRQSNGFFVNYVWSYPGTCFF